MRDMEGSGDDEQVAEVRAGLMPDWERRQYRRLDSG